MLKDVAEQRSLDVEFEGVDRDVAKHYDSARALATTTLAEGELIMAFKMMTSKNIGKIQGVIQSEEKRLIAAQCKTTDLQDAIYKEMQRVKRS